jgi:hypothetical protein
MTALEGAVATVYRARDADSGFEPEYKTDLDALVDSGVLSEWDVQTIPGITRDADADEMHANPRWSRLIREYRDWAHRRPEDIEILLYERFTSRNEITNASHEKIRFDTPFIEVRQENELMGVFPSRIDDNIVRLPDAIEFLVDGDIVENWTLDVSDYTSSGSPKHDAWRDLFIDQSQELLGGGWKIREQEPSLSSEGVSGDIDIVFYHPETERYCLVEIKPRLNNDALDKAIGQLYRYYELFLQQQRIDPVEARDVRLAIGSQSVTEMQHAIADRAGIELFEILEQT